MFKFYKQYDGMDCGPACLRMVARYYGRNFKQQTISKLCEINRSGVSMLGISEASEKMGFRSLGARLTPDELRNVDLPCILHWRQYHFVVLYKIAGDKYYIADPSSGLIQLKKRDFYANWLGEREIERGIVLLLSPTPQFYEQENEVGDELKWAFILSYLKSYKGLIIQLALGLVAGSILQLIAPFLTQSIVDVGIKNQNLGFVLIILIAQFALIIGRVSVDFIRSWILLHISTRINISILTDFLVKLMKLPMSFFDSKMTGDIMQRMNDQKNIQTFLTNSTLTTVFSIFNLVAFSIVLAYYNSLIFLVFLVSSVLYAGWIFVFLSRRRDLNYRSFEVAAQNQSSVVQLINGMQEIKLNNCEKEKRWEWEHIQARLFRYSSKNLALTQYQQGGGTFLNEGKNILISFLSAQAVINGNITLGAMVAIQYIVGQLNNPIEQLLSFVQSFQDAKISLERLNEIHQMSDEEPVEKDCINAMPQSKSIAINNITFGYPGAGNEPVLEDISFRIPEGKTTAIVGMSGSGKTTILKLLMRFYQPSKGTIKVGDQLIDNLSYKLWRSECGIVMQDGFVFSDSIERNIAVGGSVIDRSRLEHAIKIANIQDLLDTLPLGLKTKIGAEGNGISQGQRQRLLIARAVYKDPHYILFDEATNSLDANNERVIMKNLETFFKGRTVVVVAHRLSTVSRADNIIVLKKGRIIESGSHGELIKAKGDYYDLVRNQLELDS